MFAELDRALDLMAPGTSPGLMFLALLLSLALSGLMAWVYRVAAGPSYRPDIAQAQILLACIMALVLMVVGDSISRAFGAVGILSVIRFRANVKEASEAATLLSSVAVGMACGVGMFRLAVAGALFLCLVQVLLRQLFESSAKAPKAGKKKAEAAGLELT